MGGVIPPGQPIMLPIGTDSTTTTNSTGGRVMAPASKEAIAAEHRAGVDIATQQREVGDAQAQQAEAAADAAAQKEALLRQQAADIAAEQQAQADRVAAAREASAAAEEVFANHKFEDFWDGAPVGKKIAAGMALFAGGVSASYNGGANFAAEGLTRAIDRHFAGQKAELDQQREVARMRGQHVNDLFVQAGHENAALAIKHAKALEATAAASIEAQIRAGIPAEQAKNNVVVSQMLGQAEEKRREALQHYDRTFQNSKAHTTVTGGATSQAADDSLVYDNMGKPFVNAPNPDSAKKFRDRQLASNDLGKAIDELEADYKANGPVLPGGATSASAHRNGILKRIDLASKTIGELGALSGPDMGLVEEIRGGKLGAILARPDGVKNLRRMRDNALNTSLAQIGATPTPANRSRFAPVPDEGVADAPTPAVQQRAPSPQPVPKITGEDNVMIAVARRRLRKNPQDAVAREVMDLHGLKE
jgi:hypothetical protein